MYSFSYNCIHRIYKNLSPAQGLHILDAYRACSSMNQDLLPEYKEAEERYILKILNENDTNDLSQFSISKARIKKLEQWRVKNGKFDSVIDVLEVDGFGIKVLEKFCDSILSSRNNAILPNLKQKINVRKVTNYIVPVLSLETLQALSAVVSIHIAVNAVSWCVIQNDSSQLVIKHWGLYDFAQESKKRSFTQILQLAINITDKIPHGDIYVFESPQTSMQNASGQKTFIVKLEKIQLISMISAILAKRKDKQNISPEKLGETALKDLGNITYEDLDQKYFDHGVYYLRNLLPARLYRTVVGNERISTQSVIKDMLQLSGSVPREPCTKELVVPEVLKNLYQSSNAIHKEHFGHALLLGMTCLKLCVMQDKSSIDKIKTVNSR